MEMNGRNYQLLDDGTIDTVIRVECLDCGGAWVERIGQEWAAEYRDKTTGELVDFRGLSLDYLDGCPCDICSEIDR